VWQIADLRTQVLLAVLKLPQIRKKRSFSLTMIKICSKFNFYEQACDGILDGFVIKQPTRDRIFKRGVSSSLSYGERLQI
jgi:hypothetical protein